MKSQFCKSLVIATLFLLAANAWCGSKGPMHLVRPTSVAGKLLASGSYTVHWEGIGEQVQVKIYQGKNEVAAVPARVVQLGYPAAYDSAIIEGGGATPSLAEIRFSGKKFALRLGESFESATAGSAAK